MPRVLPLILATVSVLALAATEPTVTEAVVATDPCGDVRDTGELVAPDRDLCEVTFRATTSEDAAPQLDVAVRVLGDDVARDSIVEAYWDGGTCSYAVVHRPEASLGVPGVAEVQAPAHTAFELLCGETRGCTLYVLGEPVPLGDVPFTDCATDHVEAPDGLDVTVDGDTLTFHLRFAGPLAPYATDHAAGSTLTGIGAEASPATTTGETRAYEFVVCATSCHDVSSDRALASDPFHIG